MKKLKAKKIIDLVLQKVQAISLLMELDVLRLILHYKVLIKTGRGCELLKTEALESLYIFLEYRKCTRFFGIINNSRTRPHKRDSWFCSALKNVFSSYYFSFTSYANYISHSSRIFNTKFSAFACDNSFYSIIDQIPFI